MPEQDFQERTEKATVRRRRKAREEGQVARSTEINAGGVICLGFLTLYLMGPHVGAQLMQLMSHTMVNAPIIATADPRLAETLQDRADLVLLKPIGFSQMRDLAARLGFTPAGT